MVEEDDFDCETLPRTLRQQRLQQQLVDDVDEIDSNSNSQSDDDQNQSDDDAPHHAAEDAFLTGKTIRSEVNLKSLNAEDRKKFDASMEKEWASWQRFNAVEVLSPE